MWLPPMWPSAYTVATTIVPNAREIIPRSAMVNGASPFTIRVAGTEPTPMNTKNAVPRASAPRRWRRLVSSSIARTSRYYRISFGMVECDVDHTPVIHFTAIVFVNQNGQGGTAPVIQSIDRAIRVLTALQGAR